jgi:hypothetical protein
MNHSFIILFYMFADFEIHMKIICRQQQYDMINPFLNRTIGAVVIHTEC